MAQQFLHDAQVGPAFEQMRRGAVPQTVGTDVGCAAHGGHRLMDDGAGLPRVESFPARAEQQRGTGIRGGQRRPAAGQRASCSST